MIAISVIDNAIHFYRRWFPQEHTIFLFSIFSVMFDRTSLGGIIKIDKTPELSAPTGAFLYNVTQIFHNFTFTRTCSPIFTGP